MYPRKQVHLGLEPPPPPTLTPPPPTPLSHPQGRHLRGGVCVCVCVVIFGRTATPCDVRATCYLNRQKKKKVLFQSFHGEVLCLFFFLSLAAVDSAECVRTLP